MELTQAEMEHLARLRRCPQLMERFAAILELSDGGRGVFKTADEVEGLLIEEVRKLGQASMGQWALEAEVRAGQEHQQAHPGSYCGKKKG